MKLHVLSALFCAALCFSSTNGTAAGEERGLYDKEGRLIAYIYPDGAREFYTYDLDWRMVKFTTKKGEDTFFIYQPDGSILSRLPGGKEILTPAKSKE